MELATDEKTLIAQMMHLFSRTKDLMSDWREDAVNFMRGYNSYVNRDIYPFDFSVFAPISYSTIETSLPKYVNSIYSKRPMFQVIRTSEQTTKESCQIRAAALQEWFVDTRTWFDVVSATREMKLIGNACLETYHSFVEQEVLDYDNLISLNGVRRNLNQTKIEIVENRPRIKHHDMFDVYPDLFHVHQEEMEYVQTVCIKSAPEILWGPIKYNVSERDLEDVGDWSFNEDLYYTSRLYDFRHNQQPIFDSTTLPMKPRELIQTVVKEWTRKGLRMWIITILNRKKIIRKKLIRYWPFRFFNNTADPHSFLGKSDIKDVLDLNLAYNDMVNMSLQSRLMALMRMFVVGDGANLKTNSVRLVPGGIFHVDDVSQFKEMIWQPDDRGAELMERVLMEGIERAAGQSDYSRGATPPRKEFVTTVLAIQQAAGERENSKIQTHEKMGFCPLAESMIACEREYLILPTSIPDGDNFVDIDRYDLQGPARYEIHSSAMGMSELKRSQLHDLTADAAQLLGDGMPASFRLEILQAIAETYDGLEGLTKKVDVYIQQLKQQEMAQLAAPPGLFSSPGQLSQPGNAGTSQLDGMAALSGATN